MHFQCILALCKEAITSIMDCLRATGEKYVCPEPGNKYNFHIGHSAPRYNKVCTVLIPVVLFTSVQGIDGFHFCIAEREVIQLGIFPDVVWIGRAWDNHYTFLQIPAQDDLYQRHAMAVSYFLQYRFFHQLLVISPMAVITSSQSMVLTAL